MHFFLPPCRQYHEKPFILFASLFLSSASHAVSFDCGKATTFVEKAICADTLLGKLDDALSENYRYMLSSNIGDGAKKDLRATQKMAF